MKSGMDRRQFLKLMGTSFLSLLLNQCGIRPTPLAAPTPTIPVSPIPSPTATAEPALTPAPPATSTPQPTVTPDFRATAAIGRVKTYDLPQLRREMQNMLDQLGGLADVIRPGARVVIKPNLTGNTWSDDKLPAPSTEMFVTHPALVQVLIELLLDAGAGKISIVEGLGDEAIFKAWGYSEVAAFTNASLVDLCKPAPYKDYVPFPVGAGRQIYDVLYMNAVMREVDVFISVAKMKCHSTTGVTLSLKNLVGLPPVSLYRDDEKHNHRSSFHESTIYDTRLPRVVVDLNLAMPVHLAIVDGIRTVEGAAGVWDKGYNAVQPGLLVASKNALAADAVSTALMGFESDAPAGASPFGYADNHLALAREAGLGTNRINEIGIVGGEIADAVFPFKTAR